MTPKLKSIEKTQIAAKTLLAVRTVDRCYRGEATHAGTRARIEAAARELALPLPPEATPRPPKPKLFSQSV